MMFARWRAIASLITWCAGLAACGTSDTIYTPTPSARESTRRPAGGDEDALGRTDVRPQDERPSDSDGRVGEDGVVTPTTPVSGGGIVNPGGGSTSTVPTQPLPPQASGGTGGRTGAIEERFAASNGLSSTYKATIPEDLGPSKPYGLQIHLHGDGGGEYRWFVEDNVRIGRKHGLIGVVVKAPNGKCCWYEGGEANAKFLDELIQKEFFVKYNIDRRRVYFSGASGGAQFLTGQFIPLYGLNYNSGAVLLCGGPANWQNKINSTPEFIAGFKLAWMATKGDFLLDQVEEGIAYYKKLGMQVEADILPNGDHCDFPGGLDGALESKLPLVLR